MKNLLLFSTLLLIAGGAFAQLTVKPVTPSSGDSYIYVKDEILYVEKGITLTKNPTATIEASIYLRGDGQLIQAGKTSTNYGDGFLSAQQTSPITNAWAYYDWCSPVGHPVESVIGNTTFGIGSIYEDINKGLNNVPTPGVGTQARKSLNIETFEGYTDPQLTISTRWLYILRDPGTEAEGNYTRINTSNNVPAGFGFTMKGVKDGPITAPKPTDPNFGHKQLYEFRGRPNNGDFDIPVKGSLYSTGSDQYPNAADASAQMTLSGNPYPSALDLNQVFTDNAALSAIFYYDEDRSSLSHYYSNKPFGYGVWISGGEGDPTGFYTDATFYIWKADGTNSGGSGDQSQRINKPKRFAPIGQGFRLVGVGDSEADGTVTIKNSHRVFKKEDETVFFRATSDNSLAANETTNQSDPNSDIDIHTTNPNVDTRTPQLRLYVVFDAALTRDMLLIFSNEATDGFDRGYDGISPGGMNSDAFFPIGEENAKLPYVIQGTNYDIEKQIPLTFKLSKQTRLEVRAVEEINKPYQRVYLWDKLEDKYTFLRTGNITAGFTLPAGTYEDRFYIVFRNSRINPLTLEELAVEEFVQKNVNFFQNNPAKQLEVRNPQGYEIKSAQVYDMAGKLVISENNLGSDSQYSFYTGNLSDGVYVVKLLTSENIIINYKAVVHNK